MEWIILLEFLKTLWLGFEVVHYFYLRKREKTLIDSVERYNQRLENLEKLVKELKP